MKKGIVALLCVVSPFVLLTLPASAQTCPGGTVVNASARLSHGDWKYLPADGGFSFSACGVAFQADGGPGSLPAPCIEDCQPGAWNAAPAVCNAKWKAANGIP